jgi:hypothetical protein
MDLFVEKKRISIFPVPGMENKVFTRVQVNSLGYDTHNKTINLFVRREGIVFGLSALQK